MSSGGTSPSNSRWTGMAWSPLPLPGLDRAGVRDRRCARVYGRPVAVAALAWPSCLVVAASGAGWAAVTGRAEQRRSLSSLGHDTRFTMTAVPLVNFVPSGNAVTCWMSPARSRSPTICRQSRRTSGEPRAASPSVRAHRGWRTRSDTPGSAPARASGLVRSRRRGPPGIPPRRFYALSVGLSIALLELQRRHRRLLGFLCPQCRAEHCDGAEQHRRRPAGFVSMPSVSG